MKVQLVKMLREPKYLGLAFSLSLLALFLYPFLQVLAQGLNNFWFWFSILTPLTWLLYILYGISFGLTFSFFLWQRSRKICLPKKAARGGFLGLIGSILGTAAPLCPACLPWTALFLPFGFSLFLARHNIEMMAFSVALLLLALWLLGGFKKS